MIIIDAKGKACPMPVILAKKQLEQGQPFAITVDNHTAVENLRRLAASQGAAVEEAEQGGGFTLTFTPGTACAGTAAPRYVVFLGKNTVGAGEEELGENLMKMLLYTLAQSGDVPAALLLMNSGVKLAAQEETAAHLAALEALGTEVLVCGTCLNYYGLTEARRAGTVSNMYDILSRMQQAEKVITL